MRSSATGGTAKERAGAGSAQGGAAATRRVAAITGAASGLGAALAVELARRGWAVAASDLDAARLDEVAGAIEAAGGASSQHPLDVRDAAAVDAFAAAVFSRWGRCDLLINNAGVAAAGVVGELGLDDWRWCMDVDLLGPIHGCHAFTPRLRAQGSGHIVNVASIAAIAQAPAMGPYNVAKAGVVALSMTLRAELAGSGVSASAACPGFFRTRIAESMRASDPRLLKMTERLVGGSPLDAATVAQRILAGVERDEALMIIGRDARLIWLMRRLMPVRGLQVLERLRGLASRRRRRA